MISREQFETELEPLRAALEERRRKFLRYFYASLGVASLLVATAFFAPAETLHAIQRVLHVQAPVKPSDIAAYRLFSLLCAAGLTLGPVLSYRGDRRFSVQRAVFLRILNFFGDFTPLAAGGIGPAEIRKAPLFAPPLLFLPEEGAMGEMNGVRVRICDAAFYRRENERDRLVFNGVFILCDAPPGMQQADPSLLSAALERLAAAVQALPDTVPYWDEKLAYGMKALYSRMHGAISQNAGKDELPAEKEYRLKYATRPLLARAAQPQAEDRLFSPYGLESSPQRSLAAVAGDGRLFTLESFFTPALGQARMRYLYAVMESLSAFTRVV